MRSKLKEIDSLCDAIFDGTKDEDGAAGEIKAIVADLLTEDWDCTLQALEVIQYRNALDEIATKADHSWALANIARNAIAEADRVRDGQPMTLAALIAENESLRVDAEKWRDAVKHGTALQDEARAALAAIKESDNA